MSIKLTRSSTLVEGFSDAIDKIALGQEEFLHLFKQAARKRTKITDTTAESLEAIRLEFFNEIQEFSEVIIYYLV
jgi:hypothetical protein